VSNIAIVDIRFLKHGLSTAGYKRQLTQFNKDRFVLYTAQNQTETPDD